MLDRINKLDPRLIGIHVMNAFAMHNSSSRGIMFGSHFAQHLVCEETDPKPIFSGAEYEMAKYTIASRMPADGRIIKTIVRYPPGVDKNSLNFSPETLVIYQKDEDHQYDMFAVPYYLSMHQFFGYKGKETENMSLLNPGTYVAKDTVFKDTPCVSEDGAYEYGSTLNTAFMTVPSVAEDGVVICEDVLHKFRFRVYDTRIINTGTNTFPLNLYGDTNNYRPFPEIGDMIRDDGILMAVRKYDPEMNPAEMSIYDCREVDQDNFDTSTYVRGPGGRIVDIRVMSNNLTNGRLPDQMKGQLDRYKAALDRFHHEIVNTDKKLRSEHYRKYGTYDIPISPYLQRQVVESMAHINAESDKFKQPLLLNHRMAPLDEYRIEITVEYIITPGKGYKYTDSHGTF